MKSLIMVSVVIVSITRGLHNTISFKNNCKNKNNNILKHYVSKNKTVFEQTLKTFE